MNVRARLAHQTQGLHDGLHRSQVLSKLTRADMTRSEYVSALTVFQTFFAAVERERERRKCWPDYNIRTPLVALRADLGANPPRIKFEFENKIEALGGLYVAHGAFFGRSSFRTSVLAAIPDSPHRFMSCRFPTRIWSSLCRDLEEAGATGEGYRALASGATNTFGLMAGLANDGRLSDQT